MLAASLSFPGQNVELQPGEQFLKIVQAGDNSNVLDEINFDEIDENRIEITAATFQVDTDVNLAGYDLLVSAESILVVNGGLLGAGQVVLSAVKQPDLGDLISDAVLNGLVANESQTIDVRNSTISANQITLSANGITSTGWSELGGHQDVIADELITQLQTLPQIGLSGAVSPLSGQAKIHNASAGVTLADSVLRSVGAIEISATATADSSLNSIAVTGLNGSRLPTTVSVGFSHSTSSATIEVLGTTQMEATGSVNLVTDATSTAINVARNEANSRARSQDAEKVKTAVNLSLALTNETSTIDVSAGTTIHSGGEVNVKAVSEVINDVTATTAVFNDGTVGFSAAVGVDNAIVRSEVNGTIQSDGVSGSEIDFTGADIFSSSDYLLLNDIPATNPILAGERLTYRGETPMPGLIDGEEYIVREANIRSQDANGVQQTVRLARAESVDLENANVDAEAVHSLTRLSVIKFDASEVSSEDASNDGRIEMTLPDGVSSLVYLGSEAGDDDILPQSITGLKQNQRYEAVQIGSQVKLRLPGTIDFVDFSLPAGTSGTHGFRYDENRLSFNPLDDVNAEDDWISLPADHRFQTGDFLLYATDPSRSEEHEMFAFDASERVVSSLGSVSLPDAPINGLDNHHGYYAVVDPLYPNQLRLTGSLADAFGSATVDISFGGSTDHTLMRTSGGISVIAQLSATNKAEAGVNLTQGEQPWSSVLGGVGAGRIENIGSAGLGFFDSLRDSIQGNGVSDAIEVTNVDPGATRQPGSNKQGGIDAAGSFVVSVFHHDVNAIIGATADLASSSSITVDADIVQRTRLGAIGESTRNALNEGSEEDEPNSGGNEFAVSAGYGLFNNDARAIVEDAVVDDDDVLRQASLAARGRVNVDAQIIYPFLGSSNDGVNAAVTLDQFGLGSFESLLDGTHGLAGLVNVYARTLADGGDQSLALALGLIVTNTTNEAIARIGEGAMVQANTTSAAGGQSVRVGALLDTFNVGAGQMSALNLSLPGFAEAVNRGRKRENGSVQDFLKDLADPLGVSGKNAAGGTMLLTLGDHKTVAEIAESAKIGDSTPSLGDTVDVSAISDIYDLALVQTGTASSQFGFSAAIAASNIRTDTRASVADGVALSAGQLRVTAEDILDRINVLGAFLKGKQIGVGTSIGVNVIDQNSAAFLGRTDRSAGETSGDDVVLGFAEVDAAVDGDLFSLVISGGVQGVGSSSGKADANQIGPVSINAPVAVNDVASNAVASVDSVDGQIGELTINATSDLDVNAVVIGASFGIQTSGGANAGKLNLGGAGAVGVNTVVSNVEATLTESDLQTQTLSITAIDNSIVEVDAGGLAIVASLSPQTRAALSFGVSIAINDVSGLTLASADDAVMTSTSGDYNVSAESNSKTTALSIAGSGSGSTGNGSFGGAGAASQNSVAKEIRAEIVGGSEHVPSKLTLDDGSLQVTAIDTSTIIADAGGVGIGVAAGPGASVSGAVGIGIAINDVANILHSQIVNSTVEMTGTVRVESKTENTSIQAHAIAASAGVAGSAGLAASLAGAGAGSGNQIANRIFASIVGSGVESTFAGDAADTDAISILASDDSTIAATTIGASLAASVSGTTAASLAVGISISENVIANEVVASSVNSMLTSSAGIAVSAIQVATIDATATAASLGVAGGNVSVGISGAGASATNEIHGQTIAMVDGGVISSAGHFIVSAIDESVIGANILAATIAIGAGNIGAAASFGFATASNRIGDESTHSDDLFAERATGSARVMAVIHNAEVIASERMTVIAESNGQVNSMVQAASMAAAAGNVGASIAGAGVTATNNAEVEVIAAVLESTGTGINSAGTIAVRTNSDLDIESLVGATTLAIAAGSYAGGISVAVSDSRSRNKSTLRPVVRNSRVSSDVLRLEAYDRSDVTATAVASAVSIAASPAGLAIAGGGVTAVSELVPTISTELSGSVLTDGGLVFETFSNGESQATTNGLSVSLGLIGIGASGSSATAIASPMNLAKIVDSEITVDAISLLIGDFTDAFADAAGLVVSTGLAVGVSTASTETNGRREMIFDNPNHSITANSIFATVWDSYNNNSGSSAMATGSSGGILLGVDATVTSMQSNRSGLIELTDGTTLNAANRVNLNASTTAILDAQSLSVVAGLVASGVTVSNVESNPHSEVRIGEDVSLLAGDLFISAQNIDVGHAHTAAGAGGGISGAVAVPSLNVDSDATVSIGDGSQLTIGNSLQIHSKTDSRFDATLLAAAGGLLSGGGGRLANTINVDSHIDVGKAVIEAQTMVIESSNKLEKSNDHLLGTVDATTGGLIAGVGSHSTTDLTVRGRVTIDGELTIDNVDNTHARIASTNHIDALEQTTLRSGGIAAGGTNSSTIRTLVDDALVDFNENASVNATGAIDIYAGGGGDIEIQSNSETFGAATVGAGVATIEITPRNRITLNSGSEIVAQRDLNLSAGTDTSFTQDEYNIRSRVDSFAGSLIPIDFMDAVATLDQDNQIMIGSGAAVRSGGHLRMHAEQFGDNNVVAQVKAVNWTTGVAGAIDGLLAQGGVEQFGGTATSQASGVVTVDGTAETGIARNRILQITDITRGDPGVDEDGDPNPETPELFTVGLGGESTGDIAFEKRLLPVNSAIDLALQQAESQLNVYSDNMTLRNFYESEVARLKADLVAQNLVETLTDSNGNTIQQRITRNSLTLAINPVFAQAGRIDVRADSFRRENGQLIAPGDARVEIINQSPASLIIEGIEVTQDSGGVFSNGVRIGGGEGGDTEKEITVENLFVPPSGSAFTWPNITIANTDNAANGVTNLGGDVLLRTRPSGAGSIVINAPVNARSQRIIAGNSGTVVINLPDVESVYENETEHARLQGFLKDDEEFGNGTFNGTVRIENNGSNSNYTAYLNQTPQTPSLIGASIFVSAQYINVNGLIQSGKPEYNLTITSETADEIADLRLNERLSGLIDLRTLAASDLLARYDADRDRIVVEEQTVSGGYVDLTGHITNTRNGEIRVLSDYAKIHIDNQTDIDIEVKRLDVSRRGEGTVIIKDLSGASVANPNVSIYEREGDVILANTPSGQQSLPNGTDFVFHPQNGLRYGWTIAEEEITRIVQKTETSAWLGLDFIVPDEDDVVSTSTQTSELPDITDAGPYFYRDPGVLAVSIPESPRYTYQSEQFTISSRSYTCCGHSETNWIGTTTYYNTFIEEHGTRTLHTHTIEADRPIDIRFEGRSEGEILIESLGNVFIDGAIVNPGGITTIRSDRSVYQGGFEGVVGGVDIRIQTAGGIGSADDPLRTDLNESVPFDLRSDRVEDLDGVEQVPTLTTVYEGTRVLFVSGPEERGEAGSVYHYLGQGDNLDLNAQDYTDTLLWSIVEQFPSLGFTTNDGNAFVHEVNGDLAIERIHATRLGLETTDGDITLIADGNIVHGRSSAENHYSFSIIGNSISLTSENGSIGQLAGSDGGDNRPLFVFADTAANVGSGLAALAAQDIYLTHVSDSAVNSIRAGGDVRIDNDFFGTLSDVNFNEVRDERAIAEVITKVWDDLQLTEGRGSTSKRNERVQALNSSQTQSYNAYWNYRDTQTDPAAYDPDHRVRLSRSERDFHNNDTDTIATIENSRTTQYHELHLKWGPLGNTRIDDYQHEPTEEELHEIDASMKVWTEAELLGLRSREFLNVTDTEFVVEEPNIVGRTITLNIKDGIGRYDNGVTVDLREIDGEAPVLTLDQQAKIVAAEPGDLVYLDRAPDEVVAYIIARDISYQGPSDSDTPWQDLGYSVGDRIFLETNTRDTTDTGKFFKIEGFSGVNMLLDLTDYEFENLQDDSEKRILVAPVFTGDDPRDAPFLRVLRREDLDVSASERVVARSERHIYLGSESDFPIDRVHAGVDGGRVQIKAAGSLFNVGTDPAAPNIIGSRIVVESADNRIGTLAKPLRIDMDGVGSLIARAENEVAITEQSEDNANSDLRIDQVFSQSSIVQLQTNGAIIDANDNAIENVRAAKVFLRAATNIGSESNPIEINMIGDGNLTATADEDIHITEVAGNLGVRQVLSFTGDVSLVADVSLLDAIDVANPYDPTSPDAIDLTASLPAADVIGFNVFLTANLGFIGAAGNELDIDSGFSVSASEIASLTTNSDQNTFLNEVAGDLTLGAVTTDEQTAFIASINGSILQAAPDVPSIQSAKLWLFARDDIGLPTDPIDITTGAVEGIAITGSVYLAATGDLTVGGVVDPASGAAGEQAGEFTPTRELGSSGFQSGLGLSIKSTETLTIVEDLQSLGSLSIQGDIGLELPSGVSARSAGQLDIVSRHSEIRGSVDALETIVQGTAGNDTLVFKPESLDGPVRIEAGDGDDQIDVVEFPMTIDGGAGTNTIIGAAFMHEVVAAPFSANATTHQRVSTKENFSQTPLSRFVSEFAKPPVVTINDDRFEFSDGVLRLKPDRFLQHPDDDELSIALTFTDPDDAALSVDQVVTITTQANASVWTNPDLVEDVNRSGHASALDALIVINFLNRVNDPLLPMHRSFDSMEPFYDVNRDGRVTALDALRVINALSFGSRVLVGGEPLRSDQSRILRTGETSEQPVAMSPSEGSNFVSSRGDLSDEELDRLAEDVALVRLF